MSEFRDNSLVPLQPDSIRIMEIVHDNILRFHLQIHPVYQQIQNDYQHQIVYHQVRSVYSQNQICTLIVIQIYKKL